MFNSSKAVLNPTQNICLMIVKNEREKKERKNVMDG